MKIKELKKHHYRWFRKRVWKEVCCNNHEDGIFCSGMMINDLTEIKYFLERQREGIRFID